MPVRMIESQYGSHGGADGASGTALGKDDRLTDLDGLKPRIWLAAPSPFRALAAGQDRGERCRVEIGDIQHSRQSINIYRILSAGQA